MAIKIQGYTIITNGGYYNMDLMPSDSNKDLGRSTNKWRNMYLEGNAYLDGNSQTDRGIKFNDEMVMGIHPGWYTDRLDINIASNNGQYVPKGEGTRIGGPVVIGTGNAAATHTDSNDLTVGGLIWAGQINSPNIIGETVASTGTGGIKIGAQTVINSSRNLANLGNDSADMYLYTVNNAADLRLEVGGTLQASVDLSEFRDTTTGSKTYTFYDKYTSGETKFFSLGTHDICFQSGWTATQDYGSSWHKCRVVPMLDGGTCGSSLNYPENGDTVTGTGEEWCMSYGSENSTGGDDRVDCRATCIDWTSV